MPARVVHVPTIPESLIYEIRLGVAEAGQSLKRCTGGR